MSEGAGAHDVLYTDFVAEVNEQSLREVENRMTEVGNRAGQQGGAGLAAGMTGAMANLPALVAGVVATAAAAAGAIIAGAFITALNGAAQSADNVAMFKAKLGETTEEAERLGAVAEEVFANNWGANLAEAGEFVKNVRSELRNLTDKELVAVTSGTAAIADVFEQEQSKVAQSVKVLMENTGASAQQALDFISKGFQGGLDTSGDFLDTLLEYGPVFGQAGASAGELFSLLESGAASGVLGVDKIADAFKEFTLKTSEGSKDVMEAYAKLGLSYSVIDKQIAAGAITQTQAFEIVTNELKKVKDVSEKTNIAAALMGGPGEDLGKVRNEITTTAKTVEDLNGATDSLNAKYETLPQLLSAAKRSFEAALLPLGKELAKLGNELLPELQDGLKAIGPTVARMAAEFIKWFRDMQAQGRKLADDLAPAIARVSDAFRPFVSSVGPLAVQLFTTIGAVVSSLKPLFQTLTPVIAGAFTLLGNVLAGASETIRNTLKVIEGLLTGDFGKVAEGFKGIAQAAVSFVKNVFATLGGTLVNTIDAAAPGLIAAAANMFNGMVRKAVEGIEAMHNKLIAGINKIRALLNMPLVDSVKYTVPQIPVPKPASSNPYVQSSLAAANPQFEQPLPKPVLPKPVVDTTGVDTTTRNANTKAVTDQAKAVLVLTDAQGKATKVAKTALDLEQERLKALRAQYAVFEAADDQLRAKIITEKTYAKTVNDGVYALERAVKNEKVGTQAYDYLIGVLGRLHDARKRLNEQNKQSQEKQPVAKALTVEEKQLEEARKLGDYLDLLGKKYEAGKLSAATYGKEVSGLVPRLDGLYKSLGNSNGDAAKSVLDTLSKIKQVSDDLAKQGISGVYSATTVDSQSLNEAISAQLSAAEIPAIKLDEPIKVEAVLELDPEAAQIDTSAVDRLLADEARLANTKVLIDELGRLTDAELELARAQAIADNDAAALATVMDVQAQRAASLTEQQDKLIESSRQVGEAWDDYQTKLAENAAVEKFKDGLIGLTDEQLKNALATAEANQTLEEHKLILEEIANRRKQISETPITMPKVEDLEIKILGIDTGIAALELYKDAVSGVANVISSTFEDLVTGTGKGVKGIIGNMAKMALGIVKNVAVAIAAMQAQAIATALLETATTFNFVRAGLILAAAAAMAGLASGLANRIEGGGGPAVTAPSPQQPGAQPSEPTPATVTTSQVNVLQGAGVAYVFGQHVDRFGQYVDRLVSNGIKTVSQVSLNVDNRSLAYELAKG